MFGTGFTAAEKSTKSPLFERAGKAVRPANRRPVSFRGSCLARPIWSRFAGAPPGAAGQPACGGSDRLASGPQGRRHPGRRFATEISGMCFSSSFREWRWARLLRALAFAACPGQYARAGKHHRFWESEYHRPWLASGLKDWGLRTPNQTPTKAMTPVIGLPSPAAHDRTTSLHVSVRAVPRLNPRLQVLARVRLKAGLVVKRASGRAGW